MERYPMAADGLHTMFNGQILAIVGVVLFFIPLVGSVLAIVGGILYIVGMYKAREEDEGYRTAFILSIVNLVVNLLPGTLGEIASTVVGLLVVYFVCTTTARLLREVDADDVADLGMRVWTINLMCAVASVVISVLVLISFSLGAVLAMALVVVELVGGVLYLVFLSRAWKAL